jgi:Flp pilus assembly protein TadG
VIRRRASSSVVSPRRGAAVVEFAVVSPLFLLLLSGVVEFGQTFRVQHSLSAAARRGCRAASMSGSTNAQVNSLVRSLCAKTVGASESNFLVAISVNGSSGADLSTAARADEIQVAVSIPYSKAAVGFFSSSFSDSSLSAACVFEHE